VSRLVNHHGRAIEREAEAIKASDLMKLMDVVQAATGLYNAIERQHGPDPERTVAEEWEGLGDALRSLGLAEVQP